MDRINIQNLAMIITNKCNLECENCLCKDNNLDMNNQVIEKTFQQINRINFLHIYGGEPVMALDTLESIFKCIIRNRVELRQVDITINGTKYDSEFLRLLDYINIYLIYTFHTADVSFSILRDSEHKASLKKLGIYRETLEYIKKYMESKYFYELCKEPKIITRSENFSESYITYMNKLRMFDKKNGICNIGPLVTINPNGLITEADATLEEQETLYNYGDVNNESIESIMLRRSKVVKPAIWYNKTNAIR